MKQGTYKGATTIMTTNNNIVAQGVCFAMIPGYSPINSMYNSNYSNMNSNSSDYYGYWHVACFMVNTDGRLAPITDGATNYNALVPFGETQLFNNSTPATSLCCGIRHLTAGLHIVPTITEVTDAENTSYITLYMGAEMVYSEFFNEALTSGVNIVAVLESRNALTFSNDAGITARLDLTQDVVSGKMVPLNSWNSATYDLSNMRIPVVYLEFSQNITGLANPNQTGQSLFNNLPFNIETI